jgi:hypothetical protein
MRQLIKIIMELQAERTGEMTALLAMDIESRNWSKWDELNETIRDLRNRLADATIDAYVDEMRHTK